MAIPTALEALTVLFVLAVLAADQAEGRHHQLNCPSFSCGPLGNVSSPFRQASDPPGCGYQSYELVCSDTKATISIDNATYYVSAINYILQTFWIIDADLDLYNSCPLPRWKRNWRPVEPIRGIQGQWIHSKVVNLAPGTSYQANFVNCSQEVKDNSMYMPVACLSTSHSFVYVLTSLSYDSMKNLEPSCGFLAMTPLDGQETRSTVPLENVSYADVVKFMKYGFSVGFPSKRRGYGNFKECLMDLPLASPKDWILSILLVDVIFLGCAIEALPLPIGMCLYIIQVALPFFKLFAALCRFVFAPLVVLIFLAYKYWKTRITIDAVEKFLVMQQMISPSRYAYTDIVAVTNHFRNKLGQGGYGSVYEGVLPGDVHVYDRLAEQEVHGISPTDDMHELEKKLCIVGLWCIQMRSQDRPTMGEVIEMLEGGVDGLQMPSRPFFCDEGHIHIEDSYHLSSELTAISEEDV